MFQRWLSGCTQHFNGMQTKILVAATHHAKPLQIVAAPPPKVLIEH
jgi:hypothetical protein